MKKLLFLVALASLCLSSCTDHCREVRTYKKIKPISIGYESLKASIKTLAPRELSNPAKIYAYDKYLFISEAKKGIHIIDNANPASPKAISFISVPGVLDMAIKDDVLYVDNYTDLVALSISNPADIKEIGRNALRFNNGLHEGLSWYYDPFNKVITDYESVLTTETVEVSCDGGYPYPIYYRGGVEGDSKAFQSGTTTQATGTGQGGSMARFTIYDNYLYAATQSDLLVFSVKNAAKPDSITKVNLGWGIETIFPYGDKLFIGSNTGMHIYDNKNPTKPTRLSLFQHARACDPVVVEGDRAYVTLRQGWCGAAPNQLDVINISNLSSPSLIKSYTMQNPHGLSVSNKKLMLCEGKFGLKSFDVSIDTDIKMLQHIKDHEAYDVIQLPNNILLMIGKDGLFQYDNSNASQLKLLSSIPVKNK